MRSEIRNIHRVAKFGAHGNPDAQSIWIYGKRRDGKTVACKSEIQDDGSIQIFSQYGTSSSSYLIEDMTEFSKVEWSQVKNAGYKFQQKQICNQILDARE